MTWIGANVVDLILIEHGAVACHEPERSDGPAHDCLGTCAVDAEFSRRAADEHMDARAFGASPDGPVDAGHGLASLWVTCVLATVSHEPLSSRSAFVLLPS